MVAISRQSPRRWICSQSQPKSCCFHHTQLPQLPSHSWKTSLKQTTVSKYVLVPYNLLIIPQFQLHLKTKALIVWWQTQSWIDPHSHQKRKIFTDHWRGQKLFQMIRYTTILKSDDHVEEKTKNRLLRVLQWFTFTKRECLLINVLRCTFTGGVSPTPFLITSKHLFFDPPYIVEISICWCHTN